MTKQTKILFRGAVVLALELACFGKIPTLTGKMVAYDLMAHSGKAASFVENKEVVILDVPAKKSRFVKLVFQGYGTVQVDPKYFSGDVPLTVRAERDKTCDQKAPTILAEMPNPKGGTYLLTDAYKKSPPPKMKVLECYVALSQKK